MLRFFQQLLNRSSDTGAGAERLAADWLKRERRMSVIAQNWRNPRDRRQEIDLVCRDGDVIVFVEVKARAAGAMVRGFYAVNRRKKRALLAATKAYLARMAGRPKTFRFDVVEVLVPEEESAGFPDSLTKVAALPPARRPEVNHYENVPFFRKDFT